MTPPPSPQTTPPGQVHQAATTGYAAGAATYAQGRPTYPPELAGWLRDVAGAGPGRTVVDLGAGTGKFTRLLVDSGAAVVAVEPVAPMLDRLRADLPGVQALAGSATAIPLPDDAADVLACAQAFHWFATPAALDEMARVLRPGGRLALVWNLRDAQVPWVARLNAIVDRHEGEVPRFYKGSWRAAFPHPALDALREWQFPHAHTGPAEDVIVKRALSTSFISALPPEGRQAVEAELRALIASEPALQQPVVSVPYRTFAYCCTRQR